MESCFSFAVSPKTFAPKLVIVDFSDMPSMEDVVAEVVDCYGCVDVLICNSSMKLKAPVQSISLEVDRNIMDINYFGPSTLAKGGRVGVTSKNIQTNQVCDIQYLHFHVQILPQVSFRP